MELKYWIKELCYQGSYSTLRKFLKSWVLHFFFNIELYIQFKYTIPFNRPNQKDSLNTKIRQIASFIEEPITQLKYKSILIEDSLRIKWIKREITYTLGAFRKQICKNTWTFFSFLQVFCLLYPSLLLTSS